MKNLSSIKLAAVADLHGYLPEIPECDVLVVAGDVCPMENHEHHYQRNWLRGRFTDWLNRVPAKEIVGLAGNHDFVLDAQRSLGRELPWHYLLDSSVELFGYKFYGYPWVPNLPSWAFYASDQALLIKSAMIPKDTDILVTHGPPAGVGDQVRYGEHVGDTSLTNQLSYSELKPLLHLFGHIHEGRGRYDINGIKFAGVSMVDEMYNPLDTVMEFNLESRRS